MLILYYLAILFSYLAILAIYLSHYRNYLSRFIIGIAIFVQSKDEMFQEAQQKYWSMWEEISNC